MGRARILIPAGFVLLLFLIIAPNALANNGQIHGVDADNLNVRSAPSHSAEVLGQLSAGDQAVVFQKKYGWAQTYYNGQVAWVASHFLYPMEDDAAASSVSAESETNTTNTAESQQSTEPSGTLNGYSIVLDPGHGGNDPGAIGYGGTLEKTHTMNTAYSVAEELRAAGATVMMTRSNDTYVSLEDRVSFSNAYATDAFISLHYNAFPFQGVNGFSTYYHTNGNDRALANDIQSGLNQHMTLNSRGIMQDGYHVLRENSDLAVLVELGFITNPHDLSVIRTEDHQANVADGIVEGVINYFN
ncbi:N-acetylmuramoyl-L-alanine amidase [Lentibacillus jeotgali]|uniref:N-acetylmuramoyl-L-alanine amidase n=1 Tax=Lentibacillus jeotgali TaxID=558169 RepID=UPI0002628FEC|nr:N-acetylmuramoyl-L-alanine amidase [Lentibacillus jeotgali]